MTAIIAFLTAKASGIAVGVAIPLIFALLYKMIPKKITGVLVDLFAKQNMSIEKIEDPIRRELYKNLSLDIVKIVEYEIPDKGMGKEKYEKAAEKLCSVLPFLKGQDEKIEKLIEESVVAMDLEFKKQLGIN
jgi:hypothetical protein